MDAINELIIVWKDFPYSDCEKIRFSMMIQDWE